MNWKARYGGGWNEGLEMFADFIEPMETFLKIRYWGGIAVAYYDNSGYDGDAYVLYHDRLVDRSIKPFTGHLALYEIHGSHCSCYGLETQWKPQRVTVKALRKRIRDGEGYGAFSYAETDTKAFLKNFVSFMKETGMKEAPSEMIDNA